MVRSSLFKKKVMAFKQVGFKILDSFFANFFSLRENYRASSQVVFNRGTRFWQFSLLMRPQPALCRIKSWILEILWLFFRTFDCFWKLFFFFYFPIKSGIKSSTERTGCDNGSCWSGVSLFFAKKTLSFWENWLTQNFLLISFIWVETYLALLVFFNI